MFWNNIERCGINSSCVDAPLAYKENLATISDAIWMYSGAITLRPFMIYGPLYYDTKEAGINGGMNTAIADLSMNGLYYATKIN